MNTAMTWGFRTPEETEITRQRLREACKRSSYFLATWVLGMNKFVPHVHGRLGSFLDATPIPQWDHRDDLLVMLPRDFYKSSMATIAKTLQNLIRNPSSCTLIVNEKVANAQGFVRSIRLHLERNKRLRWLFPELIPDIRRVKWSDNAIVIRRPTTGHQRPESSVEAIGVDGTVVSKHFDCIILDDLIGEAASQSPAIMEQARQWIRLAEHLFADPKVGQMYIVGTRWAHDDIYGDLMADETVRKFILPGEISPEDHATLAGMKDFRRGVQVRGIRHGIPTFPEQFPAEELNRLHKKSGSRVYSCMVLLDPTSPENAEFKEEWLNYYDTDPEAGALLPWKNGNPTGERIKREHVYVATMVDPSTDSRIAKSKTAIITAAKDVKGRIYVLDVWAKLSPSPNDVISALISRYKRFSPSKIGWEANSFLAVYGRLVKEIAIAQGVQLPIVERKAGKDGDKDTRIRSLDGIFEAGYVYIKRGEKDFLNEYTVFPMSSQKDVLDAFWYLANPEGILRFPDGRQYQQEDDSSWHEAQLERFLSHVSPVTGYAA